MTLEEFKRFMKFVGASEEQIERKTFDLGIFTNPEEHLMRAAVEWSGMPRLHIQNWLVQTAANEHGMSVNSFRKFMDNIGATSKQIENCVDYALANGNTAVEREAHLLRFACNLSYWSREDIEAWLVKNSEAK